MSESGSEIAGSETGTNPKVKALEEVFIDRDPFCSGVCSVPEHQLLLYYAQREDVHINRIDFAHPTTEDLEALSGACHPASFGFNDKDVLDESYRKAGKMDLDTFSTSFDPRSVGIHDVIEQDLLSTNQTVELELYKLNVYGKDGFFKAHKDTPRGENIFGTLVVVLPAPHEGGQLSLRVDERRWIMDFTDQVAAVTEPSVYFVAFFGDVEHQVLPVTSGHRVTLTYNLYFRSEARRDIPHLCRLPIPFHDRLKEALIELVNDPETLPNGGYLAFGLCHPYAYDERKPVDSLQDILQGSDAALVSVCGALGLPCTLRLAYVQEDVATWPEFDMLSRVKLDADKDYGYPDEERHELLENAVYELTHDDLEGVDIIGRESRFVCAEEDTYHFMKKFYKDPVSQVLRVKKFSSVLCETSFPTYGGSEASLESFHGTATMVISVKPVESRERLAM